MCDRRNQDRGGSGRLSEYIGQTHQSIRDVRGERRSTDVQRIDDVAVSARPSEGVVSLESTGGDHVQGSQDLERCAQPGIHLPGHGGSHRDGCRDRTTHWRIIEPRTDGIEGEFSALERRRISGAPQGRRRDDLGGSTTRGPVPQEPVDLRTSCVAGLVDARQPGETGEGIAQ